MSLGDASDSHNIDRSTITVNDTSATTSKPKARKTTAKRVPKAKKGTRDASIDPSTMTTSILDNHQSESEPYTNTRVTYTAEPSIVLEEMTFADANDTLVTDGGKKAPKPRSVRTKAKAKTKAVTLAPEPETLPAQSPSMHSAVEERITSPSPSPKRGVKRTSSDAEEQAATGSDIGSPAPSRPKRVPKPTAKATATQIKPRARKAKNDQDQDQTMTDDLIDSMAPTKPIRAKKVKTAADASQLDTTLARGDLTDSMAPAKATRAKKAKTAADASQIDTTIVTNGLNESIASTKPTRAKKTKAVVDATLIDTTNMTKAQNDEAIATTGTSRLEHISDPVMAHDKDVVGNASSPNASDSENRPPTTLTSPPKFVTIESPHPPDAPRASQIRQYTTTASPSESDTVEPSLPPDSQEPVRDEQSLHTQVSPATLIGHKSIPLPPFPDADQTYTQKTTTTRVPLAVSTPKHSPQAPGRLLSSIAWVATDLESALVASPHKDRDDISVQDRLLEVGGQLSSTEKMMTLEEWVRSLAQKAEEELKHECERMVAAFERESARAMQVIAGIEVQSA